MSDTDKQKKKIVFADIRKRCQIRASRAAKDKPSEKVEEYFRSVPYQLRKKGE